MAKITKQNFSKWTEGKPLFVFSNTSKDKYSDEQIKEGIRQCLKSDYMPLIISYNRDFLWRFNHLAKDVKIDYMFRTLKGIERVKTYTKVYCAWVKEISPNTEIIYY